MGPGLAQDFGKRLVLAGREVRNLLEFAHRGFHENVGELRPGLDIVADIPLNFEIRILGEVPGLPGFAEILGMNLEPGSEVDRKAVCQLDRHDDSNEEADTLDCEKGIVAPGLEKFFTNLENHVRQAECDRERAASRIWGDAAAVTWLDPGLAADLDSAAPRNIRLSHLGGLPAFVMKGDRCRWSPLGFKWYSADQLQVRDARKEGLDPAAVREGDRDLLVVACQLGRHNDTVAKP